MSAVAVAVGRVIGLAMMVFGVALVGGLRGRGGDWVGRQAQKTLI